MELETLYDEQPEGPGFVGIKFCQEWYEISEISNDKLALSDIATHMVQHVRDLHDFSPPY